MLYANHPYQYFLELLKGTIFSIFTYLKKDLVYDQRASLISLLNCLQRHELTSDTGKSAFLP